MPSRTLILGFVLSLCLHGAVLAIRPPLQDPQDEPMILQKSAAVMEARLMPSRILKNTLDEARENGSETAVPEPGSEQSRTLKAPSNVLSVEGRKIQRVRAAKPAPRRLESVEHAQRVLASILLYPLEARRKGLEGETVLLLALSEQGDIRSIEVASSSGHTILDRAAIAAARQLGRLPGGNRELLLSVPFQLY